MQTDNDTQLPNELPPFNLTQALLRAKGNEQLVHQLILMFYADFSDSREKLTQFISVGDYENAQQLVHKLKGAAMMLAIDELPELAGAVESVVKSGNINKINLYLKALDAVLTPALNAAASLMR